MACPVAAMLAVPAEARPRRIVSLNLCTDQLVLALADRAQIAGLTRNADNADMSAEAAKARGLRIMGSSAEEILALDPDLVVGMPARRNPALAVLSKQNFRAVDVPQAESYDAIRASIRAVAVAVGHPARGEAMIARMDRDLAALPRIAPGQVAAYYQRRGYMTGTGTLVDELMNRVGLVNLAARLHKPVMAQVPLEEMVAARPDYLIMESATQRVTDQGTEMLHHPALAGMKRITIPQAWTVCGGPAYVQAAQQLVRQVGAQQARAQPSRAAADRGPGRRQDSAPPLNAR
ncbi:ABC transporter substrate-binding protein [Sphingobium sufflavum]|nr:ABC transporter substrate-binding protein [Sphingobium sufflavum]MCE7797635.1 ABC transporter substrate-binding protein [Sphingobium sufflavum]